MATDRLTQKEVDLLRAVPEDLWERAADLILKQHPGWEFEINSKGEIIGLRKDSGLS